ncbi:hypothetical protein STIAU_1815, partial [Stigmatella aurantiaca DW4/3-1]
GAGGAGAHLVPALLLEAAVLGQRPPTGAPQDASQTRGGEGAAPREHAQRARFEDRTRGVRSGSASGATRRPSTR